MRTPDPLDRGRSKMGNIVTANQFKFLLEETLKEKEVFNKAANIFNCDESGMSIYSQSGKVIVARNKKHAYSESKDSCSHVTAQICCSTSGTFLPPMLIFEGSFPSGNYSSTGPTRALYAKSLNGYMDGELFLSGLSKIFIPYTKHFRPAILVFDGLLHLTLDVIDLARNNDITLFCLRRVQLTFFSPWMWQSFAR